MKMTVAKMEEPKMKMDGADHSTYAMLEVQGVNQLTSVFDNYFAIKDALVQTDGATDLEAIQLEYYEDVYVIL
jgi:hypothetical protein